MAAVAITAIRMAIPVLDFADFDIERVNFGLFVLLTRTDSILSVLEYK